MRKIKFRGFSTNFTENEWFEGDLIHYDKDELYIMPQNDRYWDIPHDGIKVDKNSTGQSTGLKDRLDKEIYEGDILKFKKGGIMYVAWDDEYKGFVLIDPTGDEGSAGIGNWYVEDTEVIGNIFENKELLETK